MWLGLEAPAGRLVTPRVNGCGSRAPEPVEAGRGHVRSWNRFILIILILTAFKPITPLSENESITQLTVRSVRFPDRLPRAAAIHEAARTKQRRHRRDGRYRRCFTRGMRDATLNAPPSFS